MGKDDDDKVKDKTRRVQEAVILQDFMVATQRRVEQIRLKLTTNVDLELSDGEKRILNNIHRAGMMEGIIAGVASFVILRRFPRYLARLQQQRSSRSGGGSGGYVLEQPPGKVNSPFQNAQHQQQQQQFQQQATEEPLNRGGFLWRSFQFTLDTVISLLVAANVSAYTADVEHLKKTVQEIPLMEGRSGLSDNFCPMLVEELQRQMKMNDNAIVTPVVPNDNGRGNKLHVAPFDRKEILKDPHSNFLQGYVGFIRNCQKRQAVERRIREEQGMRPDEPVSIPPPGIPANSSDNSSDDDWDDSFSGSGSENDVFSNEKQMGGGDDEWTQDDASSFVSDQEDSRK